MNDRQFRQVLKNQSPRRMPAALSDEVVGGVLRSAARIARGWAAVEKAWTLAARPEWTGQARPVALRDGVLFIAARDAATLFEVQRCCAALLRDFRPGGVRRIQVFVSPRLEMPVESDADVNNTQT